MNANYLVVSELCEEVILQRCGGQMHTSPLMEQLRSANQLIRYLYSYRFPCKNIAKGKSWSNTDFEQRWSAFAFDPSFQHDDRIEITYCPEANRNRLNRNRIRWMRILIIKSDGHCYNLSWRNNFNASYNHGPSVPVSNAKYGTLRTICMLNGIDSRLSVTKLEIRLFLLRVSLSEKTADSYCGGPRRSPTAECSHPSSETVLGLVAKQLLTNGAAKNYDCANDCNNQRTDPSHRVVSVTVRHNSPQEVLRQITIRSSKLQLFSNANFEQEAAA